MKAGRRMAGQAPVVGLGGNRNRRGPVGQEGTGPLRGDLVIPGSVFGGCAVERTTIVRCLALGGLSGAALGALGPAAFFLLLAWGEPTTAWRSLGFFAAIVGLFGALPGLLN